MAGSAGTGKTIVALHRAAYLLRKHSDARVLFTTFSEPLASALRAKLKRLLGNEPRLGERIEVHSMIAAASRLYRGHFGGGSPQMADQAMISEVITAAAAATPGHKFTSRFLKTEWAEVVDPWQIETWETYRDVQRLGRKTRLPEAQRATLWQIFSAVRDRLAAKKLVTESQVFSQLAAKLSGDASSPFDFAMVDEAQDISIAQLRFLSPR